MSIIAKKLTKTFDGGRTYALKDVDLEIRPGEFVAVIGLSGAGKSTFMRTINGTCLPSSGEISVLDRSVGKQTEKGLRELRRQIGFIFQQFNLIKNIRVLQNVLIGRTAYVPLWRGLTGFYPAADRELAERALDSVGLYAKKDEMVRDLSGGQQQRVAIARSLVQEPKIILADEPMASLDPKLSEVVLEILKKVNEERGITILVNIHVLEYALKYARRIIAFRQGEIAFDGPPEALTRAWIDEIYHMESALPGLTTATDELKEKAACPA